MVSPVHLVVDRRSLIDSRSTGYPRSMQGTSVCTRWARFGRGCWGLAGAWWGSGVLGLGCVLCVQPAGQLGGYVCAFAFDER
jgi:hypothetical protein